jgi:hypothetical protein
MAYLYEGQPVTWAGGDNARGTIVAIAGADSAHVKWATGPHAGELTLTDIYDLEPVTASQIEDSEDPLHLRAVAKAYSADGETGVLNFLASNDYTQSWTKIASDILDYTQRRIRLDASMELVEEQLSPSEQRKVVQAAALALLRDAFGE